MDDMTGPAGDTYKLDELLGAYALDAVDLDEPTARDQLRGPSPSRDVDQRVPVAVDHQRGKFISIT